MHNFHLADRTATSSLILCATVFLLALAPPPACAATDLPQPTGEASGDLLKALTQGTVSWEERYRFEHVGQQGFSVPADAHTLRSVLGYTTGVWHDAQADLALLNVTRLNARDFNDGDNGRTHYPGIGDPETTQLASANIRYTGFPDTTLVGGRQKIDLDNQRWVGSANWRQIPQTFDGLTVTNSSINDVDLFYGHVFHENRAPGENVSNGTYDMNADLLHVAYKGLPATRIVGYSYLVNISNNHSLSSASTGLRIETGLPLGADLKLTTNAEYARQVNYANNPTTFGLNYFLIEPGLSLGAWTAKVGHEVLEGNGRSAVQTPMMAAHPMNGWADQFGTTPVNGLEDTYAGIAWRFKLPVDGLDESRLEAAFHRFDANHVGLHYGDELDLDATQKIATHFTVGLQYADYVADTLQAHTQKIVVTLRAAY